MKETTKNSSIDNVETDVVYSPDNNLKIVFSHFFEVRMGADEGLFSIFDRQDSIIKNFEPLKALSFRNCSWSHDSKHFSLAIRVDNIYGYFIVDIATLNFAFVKVANPYPLCVDFSEDTLVINYRDEQLDLANSDKLVDEKTTELPYKLFCKPEEIKLGIESLTFYSIDKLQSITRLTEFDKEYKLELVDNGFAEFKGRFPQDTISGYNGRPFVVYQLETFAEYGDKVSQHWLKLIKEKTNNK